MNLRLNKNSSSDCGYTIFKNSLKLLTGRLIRHAMVVPFLLILHHLILAERFILLMKQPLDSTPTPNNSCPTDYGVNHYCMRLDYYILQNNRINDSSTFPYSSMSSYGDIRTNFSFLRDFSSRVNANKSFYLI